VLTAKALSLVAPGRMEIEDRVISDPGPNEVVVETRACGICKGDINQFTGKLHPNDVFELLPGGRRVDFPLALGHEGAGIVHGVGSQVTHVKAGDKVTALPSTKVGFDDTGHYAQYFVTDANRVARIPDDVSQFEYWISEPVACGVNGASASNVQPGDLVVLIGCGYMGLLHLAALPKGVAEYLMAVDISDAKLAVARKLGADVTINSATEDVASRVAALTGREPDIVIEASGAIEALDLATSLVRSGGRLNIFSWQLGKRPVNTGAWHIKGLEVLNSSPFYSSDFVKDFEAAVRLLRRGLIDQRLLITHKFPWQDAQRGLEIAAHPDETYVKGVLLF
jgi:threonine dehydrogenase-like Zn-dependent dehydrogenase